MLRRLVACLLLLVLPASAQETSVHIVGAVSTKPLLDALVRVMRDTKGIQVTYSINLTSDEAIQAVATDKAGIAFVTKPITGEDRAPYPDVQFVIIPIGVEVVALGVSGDLWNAGLHTISRDSMLGIYEQKITNWRQAGGPDLKITFFNFPQGFGIWEIFTQWLYGDNRKAPLPKFDKVTSSEDARDTLEFNQGAIALLAASAVDGARCHALSIVLNGHPLSPTPADVAAGKYPLVRPINALVAGRPTLAIRAVTDFLASPEGQTLIRKSGALGLEALPKPTPSPDY